MTTTVFVTCPEHASWDVVCTIYEGQENNIVQNIIIGPGDSTTITLWTDRTLNIFERPRN